MTAHSLTHLLRVVFRIFVVVIALGVYISPPTVSAATTYAVSEWPELIDAIAAVNANPANSPAIIYLEGAVAPASASDGNLPWIASDRDVTITTLNYPNNTSPSCLNSRCPVSGGNLKTLFAVADRGTLRLTNIGVAHATYPAGVPQAGVAIKNYAGGTVIISNSIISDNNSIDAAAVANDGTMTITNSVLVNNSTAAGMGGRAWGGAISQIGGSLTVSRTLFQHNTSVEYGGALHVSAGSVTIDDSLFYLNQAGGGGAIFGLDAVFTIRNSVLAENHSSNGGGAIMTSGGSVTLSRSLVYQNTAAWHGGGIFNLGADFRIEHSTLEGNMPGTGRHGGALYHAGLSHHSYVTSSTIRGNGGATALYAENGLIHLAGTILANAPSANCDSVNYDRFWDLSYNLSTDASCRFGLSAGSTSKNNAVVSFSTVDRTALYPQTSEYQYAYHTLHLASTAVDAIGSIPIGARVDPDGESAFGEWTCTFPSTMTDQIGGSRPQPAGTRCDAGAIESEFSNPGIIATPTRLTVSESGSGAFNVRLQSGPAADVTMSLAASGACTVSPSSLTFNSVNWSVNQPVTVSGANDNIVTGDRACTIITDAATSADGNYNGLAVDDVAVTVTNDDPPRVNIGTSGGVAVGEGATTDSYTVVLAYQPDNTVTVTASVSDGQTRVSAGGSPGTSATLTFTTADWNTPQTVTVSAVDDLVDEANPHTGLISHAVSGAATGYDTAAQVFVDGVPGSTVNVSIADNDAAGFTITQTDDGTAVTEGGVTDSYTVRLNSQPDSSVIVAVDWFWRCVDVTSPTDWGTKTNVELLFEPGTWNVPQTVNVTAYDDADLERSPMTCAVAHTSYSEDDDYVISTPTNLSVNVTDDEVPGVTIDTAGGLALAENRPGTTDTYTVVLTQAPNADVTVTVSAGDGQTQVSAGGSPAAASASLLFTTSNWSTPQVVTVAVVNDLIDEDDTHTGILTHAASGAPGYDTPARVVWTPAAEVSVSIGDDALDTASMYSDWGAQGNNVTEGGASRTVDIWLGSQPMADVVILQDPDAQCAVSSEFDVTPNTPDTVELRFTPANWQTRQSVTVTAINDRVVEAPLHACEVHETVTSADPRYAQFSNGWMWVYVTDNDDPGVEIDLQGGLSVDEAASATADTYRVVLSNAPTADVTVNVTVGDGQTQVSVGEGSPAASLALTFTPQNWNQAQTVKVWAVDDPLDEASSHSGTIGHSVSSTATRYNAAPISVDGSLSTTGSVSVTIADDDTAPSLTLNKVVVTDNGGTATASDWTLNASGPTNLSGAGPSVVSDASLQAGTYTLSESGGPAGYTASAWNCVGGIQNGSQITLASGESATCTITNDDDGATLTLVKSVNNDNGGTATASDFQATIDGSDVPWNIPQFVTPGNHTASESGLAGYTAGSWGGDCAADGSVSLNLGQHKTCTITNNDNLPSLTLNKIVVNDNGGNAQASDWTLSAVGPTPLSGSGATGNADVASDASFRAGTYTLSESGGPAGYSASAWNCVGGTQNGAQITVGLGESATCTITADDQAPSLTLNKVVVNDNGGTANESDWTLNASGPTPLNGHAPVDSGASFHAGTYNLSESGPSGYSASDWVCVGGLQSDADTVTLGLGDSATCTITSNDIAPQLIVIKHVVNDNGGTAVASDFTLDSGGANDSPDDFAGQEAPGTAVTLDAGPYAVNETGPSDYSASYSTDCSGSIAVGETKTCTVTNNDDPPSLTLNNVVVNDNGGTATASVWTLTASGPTSLSGAGPSVSSGAGFEAGTYALSESGGPVGYIASAWNCVGGTQNGAQITLALGESATCTITNDDDLTVPTVTINQAAAQTDPTNAEPIHFTVVFSEAVTGFDEDDVTLGGTAGATDAVVSGGPTIYTVSVSGMTRDGTVVATIAAGVAGDAARNLNTASTSADNTVTYDTTAPAVSITSSATNPTRFSPIPLRIAFTEPVVDFTTADLNVVNGAVSTLSTSDSTTFTTTVTPTAAGDVVIRLLADSVFDLTGNASGTGVLTITFDNLPPDTTITSPADFSTSPSNTPQLDFASEDTNATFECRFDLHEYFVCTSPLTPDPALTDGPHTFDVRAIDRAGNIDPTPASITITIDTVAPTVVITSSAADPTNTAPIPVTVTFSEPVYGFTAADVVVNNGAVTEGSFAGTDGVTGFSFTVTPAADGTVTLNVSGGTAHDPAGNGNTAATPFSLTYDGTAPHVVSVTRAGTTPTHAASVAYTVTFSEDVAGVDPTDFSATGTGVTGASVSGVAGSGDSYTVAVGTGTGDGALRLDVLADDTIQDAAGNPLASAFDTGDTYDVDKTAPTVIIASSAGDPTNDSSISITVTFSENVTEFEQSDVRLGNATLSGFTVVSALNYTFDLAPVGDGVVTVDVQAGVALDAAGNGNAAAAQFGFTFDGSAPTVAITSSAADPTNGASIPITVQFGEPVTGFEAGDITLGNSTLNNFAGSAATYTFDLVPLVDGLVTVDIGAGVAQDAAGNGCTAATQFSISRDSVAPTVTISSSAGDPTNTSPIPVTISFSETVSGFEAGDVGVNNGAVTNFSGSGSAYTFDLVPSADGVVTVDVPTGVAPDAAGNGNTAAAQFSISYDTAAPTVTIDQASTQADPTNTGPVIFTVTFSKNVTGFETGDVILEGTAGASTAVVSGGPASYTVSVSDMANDGTIVARIDAGVAQDAAGNRNAASASSDNTVTCDTVEPSVTIDQAAGQADPTNAQPILFTVVFSENVSGFDDGDILLGGTAGPTTASVSGGPATYTVSVGGMAAFGTVTAAVDAGVVHDAADNLNAASTSTDAAVTYVDARLPGVVVDPVALNVLENGPAQTYTVGLTSQPLAGESVTVTLGVSSADVSVDLTTLVFDADTWDAPQTVTVSAPDNALADGARTAGIDHTVSSTDPSTAYGDGSVSAPSVAVTIQDDDTPGIVLTETDGGTSVREGGLADTYSVALTVPPASGDVVTLTLTFDTAQLDVSPASLTFDDTTWDTPQTVTVLAVDDTADEPSSRTSRIDHLASATAGSPYDGLSASLAVRVRDNDDGEDDEDDQEAPEPTVRPALSPEDARAQALLCADLSQSTSAILLADIPTGAVTGGSLYCRVIAEDGVFRASEHAGQIGSQAVLDRGVVQAVDIFGLQPGGVPVPDFTAPVEVCLRGPGALLYLDASAQPRAVSELPVRFEDGYTCASIPHPGMVVLVQGEPNAIVPAAPSEPANALDGCMVWTRNRLNLRSAPDITSAVLGLVPYDVTLTAIERQGEWYYVDFLGTWGWLNAEYVDPRGSCEG